MKRGKNDTRRFAESQDAKCRECAFEAECAARRITPPHDGCSMRMVRREEGGDVR